MMQRLRLLTRTEWNFNPPSLPLPPSSGFRCTIRNYIVSGGSRLASHLTSDSHKFLISQYWKTFHQIVTPLNSINVSLECNNFHNLIRIQTPPPFIFLLLFLFYFYYQNIFSLGYNTSLRLSTVINKSLLYISA